MAFNLIAMASNLLAMASKQLVKKNLGEVFVGSQQSLD